MSRMAILAVLGVMPVLADPVAAGSCRSNGCAGAIDEAVRSSGIDPADIDSVSMPQRKGTDRGSVIGLDAWVGLKSCSGSLVISLDARSCRVCDAYTRGDCSVPGVSKY